MVAFGTVKFIICVEHNSRPFFNTLLSLKHNIVYLLNQPTTHIQIYNIQREPIQREPLQIAKLQMQTKLQRFPLYIVYVYCILDRFWGCTFLLFLKYSLNQSVCRENRDNNHDKNNQPITCPKSYSSADGCEQSACSRISLRLRFH